MPKPQLRRAACRCTHIDEPGVAYAAKVIALRDATMVEEVGDEEELLQLVAGTGVRAPQWRQTVWMREHVGLVMTCAH